MRRLLLPLIFALSLAGCGGQDGSTDPRQVVALQPHDTGVFAKPTGKAVPSGAQQLFWLLFPDLLGSSPDPLPGVTSGLHGSSPDPLPGRSGCQGKGCGTPDGD